MSTFRVGLIGLPHIRDALGQLGVEVVTGDTFLETTRNLREAADPAGLPVLVEDQRQTGLVQLLTRLSETGSVTIVRRPQAFLDDSWASIPIASSLGDYLRAAGAEDIDPAADEVMVDEDGTAHEQIPTAAPGPGSESAPESAPEAAEPADDATLEEADWLSDTDEPAPTTAGPEPEAIAPSAASASGESSQPGAQSEASALTDWLSDGEEDTTPVPARAEPVADAEPPAGPSSDADADRADGVDDDDEDEDFDGFYAPTAATGPDQEHSTEPEPAAPPASSDRPRRGRRKISLPTFAPRPDPAESETGPSAEESIDQDLLDGVPDHEVGDDDQGQEGELDVDDALDDLAGTSRATVARLNTALGLLLGIYGGKGGIGKSTVALCLAQTAAETGGLSVCLIDANRGQGDLGLYMRVRKSDLPSIYDAVTIGDLPSAIIGPEQINTARHGAGDQISFSFVQAPRPQRDGDISLEVAAVGPEHYAEMIALARTRFDLVIVDTQITEAMDASGLIDHSVGPALSRGGYALGMAELSTPGVENLLTSMTYLQRLGTDPARMMTIANNISPDVREFGKIPQLLGQHSRWKGVIHHDQRIYDDMVSRRIPHVVPPMRAVVTDVLETMTGMVEFTDPPPAAEDRSRLPWWKRWLAR